jgi:hypothetical protein
MQPAEPTRLEDIHAQSIWNHPKFERHRLVLSNDLIDPLLFMDSSIALFELRQTLDRSGLRAGLQYLNQRVPHRYTVVYKLDGAVFYNMAMIDKLGASVPSLFAKVPFVDSFCRFVVDEGEFKTAASMQDDRLAGHLHRATVQSYVGLPLTDARGELYGTFCHLDFVPRSISNGKFSFLQKASGLLGAYLPRAVAA